MNLGYNVKSLGKLNTIGSI